MVIFFYKPSPNLRISHTKQLVQPFARCTAFYHSHQVLNFGTVYLLMLFCAVVWGLLKIKLGHCTLAKFVTLLNLLLYPCVLVSCFTLFVCFFFSFEVPHFSLQPTVPTLFTLWSVLLKKKNRRFVMVGKGTTLVTLSFKNLITWGKPERAHTSMISLCRCVHTLTGLDRALAGILNHEKS